MRFLHLADIHLGVVPEKGKSYSAQRAEEIKATFTRIIQEEGPKADLVLIAGDIFHRAPLKRELKELNALLAAIAPTRVVMMAGNHDYMGKGSNYRGFKWADNIGFFDEETPSCLYMEELDTYVYGLSYEHREIREALYDHIRPGKTEGYHILLAHGGDEKHIPMDIRRLSMAGFDYIALGHIHQPKRLNDRTAYAGSLEPIDRTDLGSRGYIKGEIDERGTRLAYIAACQREYKMLDVLVDTDTTQFSLEQQISEKIQAAGPVHIYRIRMSGYRDADMNFDTEALMELGNISDVTDETIPWFDAERLYIENKDNLIGMFIQKIDSMPVDDAYKRKLLSTGLTAMYKSGGGSI